MRYSISNTAEFGDISRGPRIINDNVKKEMQKILHEIQSGKFVRDWILNVNLDNLILKLKEEIKQIGKLKRLVKT